mmetsp:Transcript_168136/g.322806  ORF Transcript_168136/g.322806 Transcript_168136/m.322806 type:complete len:480 (+) Transcript_168136:68-1507(+)
MLPGFESLCFQPLPAEDVAKAAEIETASYPADEAATPEKLEYRQRVAPELFYGVYEGSTLVAFIVSTAAHGEELEEESMSNHEPGGDSICLHSVAVEQAHRRRGIARAMVRAYVDAVAADERCGSARRILLLAHAHLLGLYAQCGFLFLGPSKVEHGGELWYDMRLDLDAKRQLEFVQVDAFTSVALAGNPAAVLFTQRNGNEAWMQAVAVENNLSETAFLEEQRVAEDSKLPPGAVCWAIRWFTPGAEVELCGHATLASAFALWETGRAPKGSPILFQTRRAGTLLCSPTEGWIRMDFPAQPPTAIADEADSLRLEFARAFSLSLEDILYLGKGPETTPDWMLEVTPDAFCKLGPDMGALAKIKPMDRGVAVTCAGGLPPADKGAKRPRVLNGSTKEAFDFTSRSFFPTMGVGEDPACGSAQCILTPYWTSKLKKAEGEFLTGLMASPRGGVVRARVCKDRVQLEGQAVMVIRGRMAV